MNIVKPLAVFLSTALCGAAYGQVFQGLGFELGETLSRGVDLSTDGTTVVGDSSPNLSTGGRAWRWRLGVGFQSLGVDLARVSRTNDDGNAIVGVGLGVSRFYWRPSQPVQSVPLPGSNLAPGLGVSGDGVTVIGNWNTNGYRAAKWTQAGGVVQLPYAPSTPTVIVQNGGTSVAFAVNQDASVITGGMGFRYNTDPFNVERGGVARWTSAGAQLLTNASGLPFEGTAYDISSDGNTLLVLTSVTGFHRWTPGGGFQAISGMVFGADDAVPRISGDGSTIISYDKMWTQSRGALPITQVLTEAGCTFTGWTNLVVTGIDNNASHLCGYGTNLTGQTEAWYATVPTPGVCVITALTGVVSCRRRR